jgi:hypothetical protein
LGLWHGPEGPVLSPTLSVIVARSQGVICSYVSAQSAAWASGMLRRTVVSEVLIKRPCTYESRVTKSSLMLLSADEVDRVYS